ncbi:MAG: hypothetical protein H3C30_05320 [Candidatus Hydrogenedentes bacterium]|nr:hypothetical protein [Candidatus Hydrogenedentota bacterium]
MTVSTTTPEKCLLPAEAHQLAGRLAEVVRDLTEAQRGAQEAAEAFEAAACSQGDSATMWQAKESAQARVAALQRQRTTLEETLTAALRRELKSNAPAPSEARRLDREATTKATGEAVALLRQAHESLIKAREAFLMDGGHTRALSAEVTLVARHLSERTAFEGALPLGGAALPPTLTQAAYAVAELLKIYS